MNIKEIENMFLKSNWPKTDTLTEEITQLPYDDAKEIFLKGLKARRHGIRTASIKGLAYFKKQETVNFIEPFLADPSYETRIEAKNAIKALTGKDVLTSKGE